MSQDIRFGMYTEFQCPQGVPHAQVINDVMEVAANLDENGFDVFCTLEHPFFQEFAVNINPLAVFSALAQRTKNIRFRCLCHTLPLHNPMILAGQIAQADILTGGRLDVGVGRGHAWLQGYANVKLEESQGRFEECFDILLKGWSEERFSYDGKYYTCEDLSIVPKPLQEELPVYVVGTSGKQFRRAAENGWHIVVGGPVPSAAFFGPMQNYRDLCAEVDTEANIGFIKAIYLDEDGDRALEEAEDAVVNFLRFNFLPLAAVPNKTAAERQRLRDTGFAFYADVLPAMPALEWSYQQMLAEKVVYVGTPEKVTQDLIELYDDSGGFGELIIMSHFGGIDKDRAIRTQNLFAKHVMPVFRDYASKGGSGGRKTTPGS